jgi:filamentous hemagglutinin family protein
MKIFKAISKRHFIRGAVSYILICCLLMNLMTPLALATPSGGAFTVGAGTIDYGATDTAVTVNQAQSVIQWGSPGSGGIDTSSSESLSFYQIEGLSNSAVLNRIMSGNPTQFNGALNGQDMRIFIVNPAGVFFGDGASVNVNQLVASGLAMSNSDFSNAAGNPLAKMVFSGSLGSDVTVQGVLDGTGTGSIYLVGRNVTNNGAILCPGGLVVMVAGDTVRLGQPGSSVIVDMSNITSDLQAESDNVVNNNGAVGESGASVDKLILAAGDVFSQAIANVEDVTVIARDDIGLKDVTASGDVGVYSGVGGTGPASGASDIDIDGSVTAADITLQAGKASGTSSILFNLNVSGGLHSTEGDVDASAREHVTIGGDVVADNGDVYITADTDNWGRGNINSGSVEATSGDVILKGRIINVDGDVTAGDDITIRAMRDWDLDGGGIVNVDNLEAVDNIDISVRESLKDDTIDGDGRITINGDAVAGGDIVLHNSTDMTKSGAVLEAGEDVILANGVYPEGYDGACEELTGNEELTITAGAAGGVDDGKIYAENTTISVSGSDLTLEQDVDIDLDDFTFANQSDTHLTANSNNGSVTIVETGSKPENAADQWASIGAAAQNDITLSGDSGDITTRELTSETGNIEVSANGGKLFATETIEAKTGSVNLTGADGIEAAADLLGGTNVNINSDLTLTAGEWVLDDDGWRWINGDQLIEAANGTVTAASWIWKETPGELFIYGGSPDLAIDLQYPGDLSEEEAAVATAGNLYMLGNGDIQIAGDITALGGLYWGLPDLPEKEVEAPVNEMGVGGVSIISENGKIYTQNEADDYALHVAIEGYSDQSEGIGIELPLDPEKKAAILLASRENLNLGEGTELYAEGQYLPLDESIEEGYAGTDDRQAVGLLDAPATIGGYTRDEGEPIDVAVYLASNGTDTAAGQGNVCVDVDSVLVAEQGAAVIDAYDTITFGQLDGLDDEYEGDDFCISRLEVVSRVTEWLHQAVGRLPYAGQPSEIAELEDLIGGEYVLRGAGLGNAGITDGRAWVLEEMPFVQAAPLPPVVDVGISGCPALLEWAAEELGIEDGNVDIWITNTLASSRGIQPCDACARLKAAVNILQDANGTYVAALTQVIDEFASSTAPVSEEQMAAIADAIANNTEADLLPRLASRDAEARNAYALAGQYLDALTAYVSIVSNLGLSTEQAVTVATDKYIAPLITSDNAGLAAYVTARLNALHSP